MQNLNDYLVLEDIVCYDADGKPYEQYPKLWVKKDLERDNQGNIIKFESHEVPYFTYFQEEGLFNPSFALTCAIVQALYRNRRDSEANKVLMVYNEKDINHSPNTMIRWKENVNGLGTGSVIHYPKREDYGLSGFKINSGRTRVEFTFDYSDFNPYSYYSKGFKDCTLEEALQAPNFGRYIKNLTGLKKPEILIDVAKYFGKTAYVWFQPRWMETNEKTTTRPSLESSNDFFSLTSASGVGGVRGVRSKAQGAIQKLLLQIKNKYRRSQGIYVIEIKK